MAVKSKGLILVGALLILIGGCQLAGAFGFLSVTPGVAGSLTIMQPDGRDTNGFPTFTLTGQRTIVGYVDLKNPDGSNYAGAATLKIGTGNWSTVLATQSINYGGPGSYNVTYSFASFGSYVLIVDAGGQSRLWAYFSIGTPDLMQTLIAAFLVLLGVALLVMGARRKQ
jgi:hypothetical protein